MSLFERLEAIKAMRDLEQYDEASAKQVLVLSLLNELGWNTFDREEVYPEYPLDEKRLDYCLKVEGNIKVFIEVKKPSENLERHEEQLLNYAFKSYVKLAILTNGVVWWFYLPMWEAPWRDRKFFAIDIRSQETKDVGNHFVSFLEKERVASGDAIERAEKLFESKSRLLKIEQTIPRAWRQIIETPDDLLVDLMAEEVERICGHKPEEKIVISFLRKMGESSKTGTIAPSNIETNRSKMTRQEISKPTWKTEYSDQALVMNYKNSHAQAIYDGGHVLLLSGSTIMVENHPSLRRKPRIHRENLLREGTLVKSDTKGLLTLKEDIPFNSPSGAAVFVAGCSVSGHRDWRIEGTDTTLGDWLDNKKGGKSA